MFSNNEVTKELFSNNEVTKELLIAVLGANFMQLFLIAWHVVTARLYFRQVRRLAIAIGKMDFDKLIGGMLSCSGGTAEQQRYKVTTGNSLASHTTPDACSGGTAGPQRYEVTGQKAPDGSQKYRERLASVAAGVKKGGMRS